MTPPNIMVIGRKIGSYTGGWNLPGFSLVGDWGTPHELYVPPRNTGVPPQNLKIVPPPIFVDHDNNFSDIFSIFDQHNKFKDANFTVLLKY